MNKSFFVIIILLIFTVGPVFRLALPGLPLTHDGPDHVARVVNFYSSLTEGNLIPRWAENLNWGYGHPVLMFLYPLPSYIASLFHLLGFSFVDSVKLVFGLAYIASVLFFYAWAKKSFGLMAGFAGAVLYGFAPYRFVDLWVRGAIGEHVAFIFPPIIFWGLLSTIRQTTRSGRLAVTLGTCSLLLSHNAISLMFAPVAFGYVLCLLRHMVEKKKKYLLEVSVSVLLGFGLAAFFVIPAFAEGKYTLRDIVTAGEFAVRFVPFSWFLYSPWSFAGSQQLSKQLGWPHWLGILGSLIFLLRYQGSTRRLAGFFLMVTGLAMWLMTAQSELVWRVVTILQKFQFPWRFLTVTVFSTAALGALFISSLSVSYRKLASFIFCSLALVTTFYMWHPIGWSEAHDRAFSGVYHGTTDTGESSPIWSVRFMERVPRAHMEIVEGSASIKELARNSTRHAYDISADEKTRFVENTVFFPGWKVYVDGKEALVEFQDPRYRGLITFWLDKGRHKVNVFFTDTKVRRTANWVSLASFAGILALEGWFLWRRKNN